MPAVKQLWATRPALARGCDRGLPRRLRVVLSLMVGEMLYIRPHQLYAQRRRRPRMAGPRRGLDRRRHDYLDLPVGPASGLLLVNRLVSWLVPLAGAQRNCRAPTWPQLQDRADLGARQGQGFVDGAGRPDRRRRVPAVPGAGPLPHPRSAPRLHRRDPVLGAEFLRAVHRCRLRRAPARGHQLPCLLRHQRESILPVCGPIATASCAPFSGAARASQHPQPPACLHRLRSRRQCVDAHSCGGRRRGSPPPGFCTCQHDPERRHTTNLAWQERKAESFIGLAACTAAVPCRLPPDAALRRAAGGLSLGTAMAISGAAASPNMGYHSPPRSRS